jgi:hypothetical protein
MKNVYLDQLAWIELAQVHHGKSERWRDAYEAVMSCIEAGTARFPLSLSHLIELAKRHNDASRGRLVDFMIRVWNADAIRPWPQMLDREATNAVQIMMDKEPIDLTNFVFGKGISHVLGGVPTLVPKRVRAAPPSPAILRRLADVLMSPGMLASVKEPALAANIRNASRFEKGFTSRLQAGIDTDYAHPDKAKRKDIADARFMTTVVGEALVRAMMKAAPDPKSLMAARMSSRKQVGAILKNMPTFYTFHVLNHGRNTSRRVKENDIWDFALNIAIPYCDIVVTETSWCNIAKNAGLEKLYRTRLGHTATELAALLRAQ